MPLFRKESCVLSLKINLPGEKRGEKKDLHPTKGRKKGGGLVWRRGRGISVWVLGQGMGRGLPRERGGVQLFTTPKGGGNSVALKGVRIAIERILVQ